MKFVTQLIVFKWIDRYRATFRALLVSMKTNDGLKFAVRERVHIRAFVTSVGRVFDMYVLLRAA